MCLIFISLHQHPNYKLIVVANRDEFYNRKTAAADYWKDKPQILGGRDLEASRNGNPGGTWMGTTKSGRISMITNYRDIKNIRKDAPSRGYLVSDYLAGSLSPQEYLMQVEKTGKDYNGFNLVVGNGDELWYYSNYKKGITKLDTGFYGLSNHLLETPWPKVVRGKQKLKPLLEADVIDVEDLFEVMYDEDRASDNELPDTGVGLERERALSSMFIKSPNYGSRSTTVVTVDRENGVVFSERVYDLNTFDFTTKIFNSQSKTEEHTNE